MVQVLGWLARLSRSDAAKTAASAVVHPSVTSFSRSDVCDWATAALDVGYPGIQVGRLFQMTLAWTRCRPSSQAVTCAGVSSGVGRMSWLVAKAS
jgi:hypothetical protein